LLAAREGRARAKVQVKKRPRIERRVFMDVIRTSGRGYIHVGNFPEF
jgi:hypothetical protein